MESNILNMLYEAIVEYKKINIYEVPPTSGVKGIWARIDTYYEVPDTYSKNILGSRYHFYMTFIADSGDRGKLGVTVTNFLNDFEQVKAGDKKIYLDTKSVTQSYAIPQLEFGTENINNKILLNLDISFVSHLSLLSI